MILMLQRCLLCVCFLTVVFLKPYAQVNLQTGSGTFSLPIFNWQDDKSRLNSVVALSYNSGSGLRVGETASNIGQGWNLIAGGVITRMQAGEPDDQAVKNGAEDDIKKYPAGILHALVPAANGYSTSITRYPIYGWKNQIYTQHNIIAEDKQLDYFSFQFNGKAGMFVLDPSNLGVAKSLGDTKMKITFQQDVNLINQGIRTTITSFTIQDVDGLLYKFSTKELVKVLKPDYCDETFSYPLKQPKFKNGKVYYQTLFEAGSNEIANPFIVGSWYLTEIEDPLTQRKITLSYNTRNIDALMGDDIMNTNTNKDYNIVFRKKAITQTPAISLITYPDGHTTHFNYGAARIDFNGDFILSSIDVKYQTRFLSKHEIATSYFIQNRYGTPTTDFQKRMARLCLKSVRKIGIDLKEDTPPYIFDYYLGAGSDDVVPPPFSYAKDIWGFYNGFNSVGYWGEPITMTAKINEIKNFNQLKGLCFRRQSSGDNVVIMNAKAGYAKNGLLRQIIYPTGGTLSYEYTQNTGVINGSTINVGGVHVSKTSSTDGGFSNNCASAISTQYKYTLSDNVTSSLWGLEPPVNSMISENHYQPEWKDYKMPPIPFGKCYWHFQYPGIMSQQQAVPTNKGMETLSTIMGVVSTITRIIDVIKFISAGTGIGYIIVDLITDIATVLITCIGNQSKDATAVTLYNFDLNAASPLPTQFKRVEVVENNGGIGKTVQEFTSDSDYPVWVPANPVYSAKQRFAPWAYGLPKTTSVFDVNGQLIKQTLNTYSLNDSCSVQLEGGGNGGEASIPICYPITKTPLNIKSAKALILKSSSLRNTIWSDPGFYNSTYQTGNDQNMKVDIYDMFTGRAELKSTAERIFKNGDPNNFVESKTEYFYNKVHNYDINKIVTTQSNGDVNSKHIRYSSDYNTGVLATLVQHNMVSIPVHTVNSVTKFGVPGYFDLSMSATEFVQLSNGDIKPMRTLDRRFATPGTPSGLYGGPGSDISAYKISQVFTYDATGNLVGIKDEGNRSVTNIYDYNDKYIIATVINADPASDPLAYTSFETSSFGKWVVTGAPVYSTSAATGSRSFVLSSGKSLQLSSLNTSKPYVVSFWSTTGTVTVSGGATLTKSAPSYNGFTFYEYAISQGTGSVTVSGSGTIDELRIHPQSSRMRTTTYDPLIGKTAECDENNRIIYYEYDNLGRLRFIRDEKKNAVKMYEYNNISTGKQNGCPGIYYNNLISETFTKSNCGPGYLGTEVTFTVPANTYSSTISQADADAKAEFYILANGQAYANANGNCLLIYYNVAMSQNYISEGCPVGMIGGTVTYSVPAGRYSSTISQQDANDKALEDIEANGDAYANSVITRVCNYNPDPVWEWPENGPSMCQNVGGVPHLFIQQVDVNPNSSSYGTTRWIDVGTNELCPGGGGGNLYYNEVQSLAFTRNNCPPGYNGTSVTYTVNAGTYSSTVSVAAANQLALNDIAANGQNYANTNGSCVPAGCAYANCHALNEANQCINGQCEMGIWVYIDTYYDYDSQLWVCVYHYEYSDGSWTAAFYSYGSSPCYPD